VVLIRKATAEDAGGILACPSAAFEEFRDNYTAGAFAGTVLAADHDCEAPSRDDRICSNRRIRRE